MADGKVSHHADPASREPARLPLFVDCSLKRGSSQEGLGPAKLVVEPP